MNSKLWRITLDSNPEDCNLHCIMCEEHSSYSHFKQRLFENSGIKRRVMPISWIEPILREAKSLGVQEVIPTTMGDPLVSNHFEIIAQNAKKLGLKLNITHNGTFPKKTVSDWAKIILPITSDIKISWNGASKQTAESVMKGIDFNQTKLKLIEFVNHRNEYYSISGYYCKITLQLTFMQNNMHEIEGIIKFASEIGIDRIKGHHLWVNFNEIADLSFEKDMESRKLWNQIVEKANLAIEQFRKPNGTKIILENFHFLPLEKSEIYVPENYECPFLERELWISATGKISPCCAPDEERNSLGSFGNYPEKTIKDVINSEVYQRLVSNYNNNNLCRKCKMRKPVR